MTADLLVFLPFAGAHTDPFRVIARAAESAGISTFSHTYPGHGSRFASSLVPSITGMAQDAADVLRARLDPGDSVALVGYSMGSLVAFELSTLLVRAGHPVSHVVLMAATPPHRLRAADVQVESDEELISHCEKFGIIDSGALESPQLRGLFTPSLRNDILAVDRYAADRERESSPSRRLPADAVLGIFWGRADQTVEDPRAWADLHGGTTSTHEYVGSHFFLNDEPDQVAADTLQVLSTPATGEASSPYQVQEASHGNH